MTALRWRVGPLELDLEADPFALRAPAAKVLGVSDAALSNLVIVRRALDARGRRRPRYVVHVEVDVRPEASPQASAQARLAPPPMLRARRQLPADTPRPIVIGMGPCGLYAALQLAEAGLRPIVIDRGKAVEPRGKDVSRLMGRGILDPESNLCFGEGGAGTWSDGKLYTRVGGPRVREVIETIVQLGGPEHLLVDARPHLGTDRLVKLLKAFRACLQELGATLLFERRVDRLLLRDGAIAGVELHDGERIESPHVVLALGHSARDLYRTLHQQGVAIEQKAFALGFRVEHRQEHINAIQYGPWAEDPALPAAIYELSATLGEGDAKRGVYSFCMCPGGSVVPTPTDEGELCINGMSHAARSGPYANSALVVTVEPRDFAEFAPAPVRAAWPEALAGIAVQEAAERWAFDAGTGAWEAPAQRLTDYLAETPSSAVRRTTYRRGTVTADLNAAYPAPVAQALHAAVRRFDQRMRGYLTEEAVLLGVETRTSAPLTLLRDPKTLESVSTPGLYPAGEGAGYGGGIVSAAIDGLRVADRLLDQLEASTAAT